MSRRSVLVLAMVGVLMMVASLILMGLGKPTPTRAAAAATPLGAIKIELFPDKAPETVKNFLQYVDDRHYDNTLFHRVIGDFMIQGGGFESGMKEKPTRAPIKNEAAHGLSNSRGTIAMARTSDPNSATAQFFINVEDNSRLDHRPPHQAGYCVFGKVIGGMDVVDRIRAVKASSFMGHESVPVRDVIITSARRDEATGPNGGPVVVMEVTEAGVPPLGPGPGSGTK